MGQRNAGEDSPRGPYTCASCQNTLSHGGGPLPACDKCNGTVWNEAGDSSGETHKPVGSI